MLNDTTNYSIFMIFEYHKDTIIHLYIMHNIIIYPIVKYKYIYLHLLQYGKHGPRHSFICLLYI